MPTPAWLDELDLHAGPPAAAMGTHSLDEARWLLIDDEWLEQRHLARALLLERRDDVLASPTTELALAAACELDALIVSFLRARGLDEGATVESDPLAAARARVAEDLCILTPHDGAWLLDAGCVCFPSYWSLQEKVGRPLSHVHDPVPGFPGPLAARVDAFLGRLRPGRGVWRRNWSIHHVRDLYLPEHGAHEPAVAASGARWLRSEYQTLLRLPEANAVIFTIRTQQLPLAALAGRPDACARLAAVLRAWSPEQRRYKGGAADDTVIAWLDAQA